VRDPAGAPPRWRWGVVNATRCRGVPCRSIRRGGEDAALAGMPAHVRVLAGLARARAGHATHDPPHETMVG
jgi:hypothetical protein